MTVKDFFAEANYRVGDRFVLSNKIEYLLTLMSNNYVNLISLNDGIRVLHDNRPVKDWKNITHEEMKPFFDFYPTLKMKNERQSLKGLKVGMKFKNRHCSYTYLLALVGPDKYVQLVNLDGTSYWGPPKAVQNCLSITQTEFANIVALNLNDWELVSD